MRTGLNLIGTCAEHRALVPEVSPAQVSVQRLTRAKQRVGSGKLVPWCLTRGETKHLFFC